MDKRFLAILAVIIAVFIGFFAFNQKSNAPTTNSSSTGQATNHVMGQGAKNVTLTEYGDYECPVCYEYYQPIKDAVTQESASIYFQFRNLPLSAIHPNAFAAARAAEAAGVQNKYWQMHDLLYENQDPTGQSGWVASKSPLDDYFVKFAQQLGLDTNQFKQDYASSKVNDSINADLAAFNKTGQQMATPSFFLDGKYVDNSQFVDSSTGQVSTAKIVSAINAEIAAKSK